MLATATETTAQDTEHNRDRARNSAAGDGTQQGIQHPHKLKATSHSQRAAVTVRTT
jgi:hypothetical protein